VCSVVKEAEPTFAAVKSLSETKPVCSGSP
jgi:hypothetical protein